MVKLVAAAFLLLFFFTFVFNSADWSLKTMTIENTLLKNEVKQYISVNESLTNADIEDLKIGELD